MKGYIIDIDGTILDGDRELNQAGMFIDFLRVSSIPFLLATNSIKSPERQIERLGKIGISITEEGLYSPIDSINTYLESEGIQRVYTVGSESEISQIKADQSSDSPELVIFLDFEKENASYNDLQRIFELVEKNVRVITASRSPFYFKEGRKQLDTGAFVHLIESVSESHVTVFGKPSNAYFQNALSLLGTPPESTIVIGDDWQTDIKGAHDAGLGSVLISSGKYRTGDELKCNPNHFIQNFMELMS